MTEATLHATRALLERTPRVVRTLLDGLPDPWLDTPDAVGPWKAYLGILLRRDQA